MDTGEGRFEMFEKEEELKKMQETYPEHGGVFRQGETLEIRGSLFRVQSIKPKGMRLKLLKKNSGIVNLEKAYTFDHVDEPDEVPDENVEVTIEDKIEEVIHRKLNYIFNNHVLINGKWVDVVSSD